MKNKLSHIAEVLDQWMLCQQKWCYLEPIFSQYEVQRQLQSQTSKFRVVDRKWRAIMWAAQKEPKVLIASSQSALLGTLIESNSVMESILHSLETYLDTKRMTFPRFFFLSNEDMFELVSQNHNPQTVQPFLSKMFDSIKSLEFAADQISSMISYAGEKLVFTKPVAIDGLIENWLLNIEDMMQKSLRSVMSKALQEYNRIPFEMWAFAYPVQIVITVVLIAWTRKVHLSLEKESPKEHLQQYDNFLRKRIELAADMIQVREYSLWDLHFWGILFLKLTQMRQFQNSMPQKWRWIFSHLYHICC